MPREYQRKTICTYDHSKLMTAIQLVKAGDSVYNVKKKILHSKMTSLGKTGAYLLKKDGM